MYFSLLPLGTFLLFAPSLFKDLNAQQTSHSRELKRYFERGFERYLFASMRFGGPDSPKECAYKLRSKLEERNIGLVIIDVDIGDSITNAVFDGIEKCDGFVVFGTKSYGEDTGNPAATNKELEFAENIGKKKILIKMIEDDEDYKFLPARILFSGNKLHLYWGKGDRESKEVPSGLVREIAKAANVGGGDGEP